MRLPRRIVLSFPRRLAMVLAVAHGAALSVAAMLPLVWPWRASLAIGISLSLYASWRRLAAQKDCSLLLQENGELKMGDGQTARVLPHAVVWPWLIVLPLRCEYGRITLLVTPEMLVGADWRLLVSWLRWRAKPDAHDSFSG